jgi:hypothetical protein
LYSFIKSHFAYPVIGSNVLLSTLFSSIFYPYVPLVWEIMFCTLTKIKWVGVTLMRKDSIVNPQLI